MGALSTNLPLWPALSDAASVTSRSGSWSSKAFIRFFALSETKKYGIAPPTARAIRIWSDGRPLTAAKSASANPQPTIR